jgi:hypothetical protein
MHVIENINDLQLSVGDSKRMACPVCHTKNTFTITNTMGKIVWNCYKASCPVSGATSVSLSVSDVRKALGYMEPEAAKPVPFVKPDYIVNDGPECWKYLKQYGLSPIDVTVLYDVKDHRIVFPVLDERGVIVDGSGRSLGKRIPKWKRYGNSDLPYHCGCGTVAVVVEDSVSAAVVGATVNNSIKLDASEDDVYVGVAVLGTSLSEGHKRYLSQFSTIIVALDPDALPKSLKFAKELRTYCKDVRVLKLTDDLKYNNPVDILNLIALTEGYTPDGTSTNT